MGKTTTCINVAAALVQWGATVVVIDGDAQCNLTYHMKQEKIDAEELTQYKRQRRTPKRRRGQEPGSGDEQPEAGDAGEQDDGAPPEQEEEVDPDEIFPAALKVKQLSHHQLSSLCLEGEVIPMCGW